MPTDQYQVSLTGSGRNPGDKMLTLARTAGTGCTEVHGTYRNEAWWLYGGTNFMQKIEDASDVNAHLLSPCVCVRAKLETEVIECGGESVEWPLLLIRLSLPTLKPLLRQWLAANEGEFTCQQIANFGAAIELFNDTWLAPRFDTVVIPHYYRAEVELKSITGAGSCSPAAPDDSLIESILIRCGCFGGSESGVRVVSVAWTARGADSGTPLSDMFVRVLPTTSVLEWEEPTATTYFPASSSNHMLHIAFGGELWQHSVPVLVEPIA